jgi:hypothetical protein
LSLEATMNADETVETPRRLEQIVRTADIALERFQRIAHRRLHQVCAPR